VDVIISRERQTEKLRGEEPQLTGEKKRQHKPKRKGVSQAEEKQKEQQRG
jgi:hypothetical protein